MQEYLSACIETLSYAKLASEDSAELTRLLYACKTQGFFYLNVDDSDASEALETRLKAIALMKTWFDNPLEKKLKLRQDSVTNGYKPPGTLAGVMEETRDGFENLKMPRDKLINRSIAMPDDLKDELSLFCRDMEYSHNITMLLLSRLSDVVGPSRRFEDYHRCDEASQSTIMYFRYIKQSQNNALGMGHNMHTDLGTLTLLYSEQKGLQVFRQDSKSWAYVMPKPRHYIVNVGDSLRFLSGNRLLSALHRVIPMPDFENSHRYSSAYFLRPNDQVEFKTSEETVISALDWHDQKYAIFKADHKEQTKSTVLTGGIDAGCQIGLK